ncbi:MAG: urea carboxylase-associated family protein [Gammaproteobacteria bacterium]|nr:urea carboxylase-associated family protein [Gammaproteobacteria bacterium]
MTTTITPASLLWEEHLVGGTHWSGILRRGNSLRLADVQGGANVAALFYNADEKLERYNMADTLKAQHTAFLTTGVVCYSDMGRVLCSITRDTCGWHDTLGGVSNAALVERKYGVARYQEQRNDYYKNGYDSLLNELGKYGLGKRDVVSNINFFSKVTVDAAGKLIFHAAHSKAGAYVDLRFEMNTLVVLSACQHPLDPAPHYQPRPLQLTAWRSGTVAADDVCRNRCPENQRGFVNTERLYL